MIETREEGQKIVSRRWGKKFIGRVLPPDKDGYHRVKFQVDRVSFEIADKNREEAMRKTFELINKATKKHV